jgi:hypothetical protein
LRPQAENRHLVTWRGGGYLTINQVRLTMSRAVLMFGVVIGVAYPVNAQEATESPSQGASVPLTPAATDTPILPEVDIQARFDSFQRDFAKDFGVKLRKDRRGSGDDAVVKARKDFAKRLEGSGLYRWYQRAEGVYNRFEGLYNRLENSTRWATSGLDVDTDMEAALDGRLGLTVQREVKGFNVGVDVDDAMAGRLGLSVGGTVKGYRISFDVSDLVEVGKVGFRLKRMVN